ncbi:MAG TPA: transcription termination factor Rho [bacterium]|nr:transcription termination factor Rho [bacterium]HPN45939.1 transcription termination factor Rho [bacterium]
MSEKASGVLKFQSHNYAFLRDPANSFQPSPDDVRVPRDLIRQYDLVEGAFIVGEKTQEENGVYLSTIETISGLDPQQFYLRPRFEELLPISPTERFRVGDSGIMSMRVIELVAPIGKGTRGMIVASPKTGKTRLLEEIAVSISRSNPETRIIVLLIDERPEEVTHFRRSVNAEVLASSSDMSIESHVNLAELTLEHVRCELECGRDVVILLDSITRMSRAFNSYGSGSRRTLSGGLDARALEIPRRFFGMARNIEDGGSVTVIATALVDTGSRMDDYIFEEFKGTGNSEIVLDRTMAESRIFPAINIPASGTRKEELLFNEEELKWITGLRRALVDQEPKVAMTMLLKLMQKASTNKKLMKQVSLDAKNFT